MRGRGLWRMCVAAVVLLVSVPALSQECISWVKKLPEPRSGHVMAYDSARGVTVLFGGILGQSVGQTVDGTTWEWDGATWELRSTSGPSPYSGYAMAYDSARGVAVLFGWSDSSGKTWEWDGTTWTLRSSTGPSFRSSHAMAYDSARGVTVLFGGGYYDHSGEEPELITNGETWEWDGTTWTLRSSTGPSPRYGHAMAYDSARGVTVIHGGYDGQTAGGKDDETWEWDGTTWTFRSDSGPGLMWLHAMSYDSARGVTVLLEDGSPDTWEWDGTSWTLRTSVGAPSRWRHAMAYDSARGVTVLFGGLLSSSANPIGDTWEWNGTTWTPRGNCPSERGRHAMAYDSTRAVTVLFGGLQPPHRFGETWEWNGTTWTLRSSDGPLPRFDTAMAYDNTRDVTVLFGGNAWDGSSAYNGETWEWDGATWTLRSSTGPSPRYRHATAYDSARGVTVLFGGDDAGSGYLQDTWEWDGTTWTLRSSSGPSPRYHHAMAYDSDRFVTVLFGGRGASGYLNDTWEWDGTTWTIASSSGPSPRYGHAMAYDSSRGQTVLFGGCHGGGGTHDFDDDTWEWTRFCPALKLIVINGNCGSVELDPNDPNLPSYLYRPGTEVTLTANPESGMAFYCWWIGDPKHVLIPGFGSSDANGTITILITEDVSVTAWFHDPSIPVFTCGQTPVLTLALAATVMGLMKLTGSRRRVS